MCIGRLEELSSRHPDPGSASQVVIIIIIAFGPYWCVGRLQELSRHPDPGPASQVIIIIIIIIIAFGLYWCVGRLQELSRHPDPGPASQVVIIIIIIIIIAFGLYWCVGRLQELSRHPDPGPASQVVPSCNPFCFNLQIMAPGVSWAASLSLSLWVPGQGLICDTCHQLSEGVSNPSSASLKDFIFAGICLAWFLSSLLLTVSGHQIRRILLRQVLMNVWIFFRVAGVGLYVSAPQSRTGLTFLSYLSRSLADRWGTTADFTTSFLHSSRFSAFRSMMFHSRPIHSLMLSSHRFLCLPLRLPP